LEKYRKIAKFFNRVNQSFIRYPIQGFPNTVLQLDDQSGQAIYGVKCLRPLKHWDRGFEFHMRHECLSDLLLFLLSCAGRGLAMVLIPLKGVVPTVYFQNNCDGNKPEGLMRKVQEEELYN
jgi:hypothetical protein